MLTNYLAIEMLALSVVECLMPTFQMFVLGILVAFLTLGIHLLEIVVRLVFSIFICRRQAIFVVVVRTRKVHERLMHGLFTRRAFIVCRVKVKGRLSLIILRVYAVVRLNVIAQLDLSLDVVILLYMFSVFTRMTSLSINHLFSTFSSVWQLVARRYGLDVIAMSQLCDSLCIVWQKTLFWHWWSNLSSLILVG
jgi:hypothetical protein